MPVQHDVTETGHGRKERRTIQVMDAPEQIKALFPHIHPVFLIERYVTRKLRRRRKNSRKYKTIQIHTAVAVLGVTSLTVREAAPEHLAGYVRGQWTIENKVHWVRSLRVLELLHDVAFERFTERFCNTSATCGACCRRCSEPR